MADQRKCIGLARFGIDAHDAPVEDFPVQASQKDGLGRMCRTHWNQYTAGLARDVKARKAAESTDVNEATATPGAPVPESPGRRRKGETEIDVPSEPAAG